MKPYHSEAGIQIFLGDCREILGDIKADAVVTDPPYGDTSLEWDVPVSGWPSLLQSNALWCFGSFRFFMAMSHLLVAGGWRYAQEIVWEKQNGSGFAADRFKRVHEFAVHWYRGAWGDQHRDVPRTMDATARTVRRKQRPPHMGDIERGTFTSEDGGPRLTRSVLRVPSCHGEAEHPTQKPIGILRPLIQFSCPADGTVLDPFMGGGSTLVAAKEMGRKAIGIEVQEKFCEVAANRLRQGVMPFAFEAM